MSMANDPETRTTEALVKLVLRQIELVRQDDGTVGLKRLETSLLQKVCELFPRARPVDA
jgi:hypothetical protein